MFTHHFVITMRDGTRADSQLSEDGAKDVIRCALARPPVQFDRLIGATGWHIQHKDCCGTLVRVYPS